jgi:hypothetical protein
MGRKWLWSDQERFDRQNQERISAILDGLHNPYPEPETECERLAKAVLIPTPGYEKSYSEIAGNRTLHQHSTRSPWSPAPGSS